MAKVLIVDDPSHLRARLSGLLKRSGYDVVQTEHCEGIVHLYQQCCPDIVLMGIDFQNGEVIQILREIRGIDPKAQVLMLTALGQDWLVLEAVKAGAKGFVVKPFIPYQVLDAVEKLTHKSVLGEELERISTQGNGGSSQA